MLVGSKIRKHFDGHGWFVGEVTSYDKQEKLFHVYYPDDDDQEEMTEQQVKKLLWNEEDDDDDDGFAIQKRMPKSNNTNKDDDDDDAMSVEYDEEEEDEEDLDDDELLEEEITTASPKIMSTPKGKRVTHSVTPSPPPKPSSSSSVASSSSKKQPARRRRSSKGGAPTKKLNPKSIAARGLPRGALAKCPHTGFTIRTLEGIFPLKAKGAKAVPKDLSDKLLPGSFVVVAAPSAKMDLETEENIVGKTFESANDLSSIFRATYLMEAVADPAFSTFPFVEARLEAAGLLEKDTDAIAPMVVEFDYDGAVKIGTKIMWYDDYLNSNPDKDGRLWGIIENEGKTLVV
ncbi:MAG: hypothetical protein SGARI_005794, partial [Bacillariaceae sp.]